MTSLVELKDVSKTFTSQSETKTTLNRISLTVNSGEFVVLRGNNGAGKTTLLKIILGMIKPTKGQAKLMGVPADFSESKREVGVVLQETQVPKNLKVKELVTLFQAYYSSPLSVQEVLDKVKLTKKQDTFATALSGGQKQRLFFALALVGNPKFLILDEPTRNLDDEGYENFWEEVRHLKAKGVTILMVTNNKADWEKLDSLADRLITLKEFQGKTQESQIEETKNPKVEPVDSIKSKGSPTTNTSDPEPPSSLKSFRAQLKAEVLQISRNIIYLSIFVFPILLYFSAPKLGEGAKLYSIYISCGLLIAFALQSLAGSIAAERAAGWLKLVRATPLSPLVYISSKILVSLAICLTTVALVLFLIALNSSDLSWSLGEFVSLIVAFFLTAIPIFGLSIALSYWVEPEGLNAATGFTIMGILIASGIPIATANWFQCLVAFSPFYHARMLILSAANLAGEHYSYTWLNFLWLVWASVIFLTLAVWAYRRDRAVQ